MDFLTAAVGPEMVLFLLQKFFEFRSLQLFCSKKSSNFVATERSRLFCNVAMRQKSGASTSDARWRLRCIRPHSASGHRTQIDIH